MSQLPKVAVCPHATDQSMPLVNLARAASERGFSGLFLNEHTHMPVDSLTSAYPLAGGIPERYARFYDPLVALSFVAATTDLDIGTNIALVGEHDPIALAKAVATLDHLSGGRMTLGVGYGWNREEFANHGYDPALRGLVVDEKIAVMIALWTEEVAEFDGRFVRLTPSRMYPKPAQQPHVPILLGARASEKNFHRIAVWGSGWMPQSSVFDPRFLVDLRRLREVWEQEGRAPAQLNVTMSLSASLVPPGHEPVGLDMVPLSLLGDAIHRAAELGVHRVWIPLLDLPSDGALAVLDHIAEGMRSA
jgi:probable F420-dependent oxidoreductase